MYCRNNIVYIVVVSTLAHLPLPAAFRLRQLFLAKARYKNTLKRSTIGLQLTPAHESASRFRCLSFKVVLPDRQAPSHTQHNLRLLLTPTCYLVLLLPHCAQETS